MRDILERLEDASNFAGNVFEGIFQDAKKELTAANERIRELDTWKELATETINGYVDLLNERDAALTAEREVSDKLEKALKCLVESYGYVDYSCDSEKTADPDIVRAFAALAEVAAIRANHGAS